MDSTGPRHPTLMPHRSRQRWLILTNWKEHDSYRKAFDRLLRDLKAEEKRS